MIKDCIKIFSNARTARVVWIASVMMCAFPLFASQSPARRQQVDPNGSSSGDLNEIQVLDRKVPSFWHRAKKDTPAEQLEYAVELEQSGKLRKARKAYDALVHRWHDSPEAPRAQLGVARTREKSGSRIKAFVEYQYAVDSYSGLVVFTDVIERQFEIANELRGEVDRGVMGFGREAGRGKVVKLYEHIARNAPNWSRADECYYLAGRTLEDDGDFVKAIVKYETLVSMFPSSKFAGEAMLNSGFCRARLADRSPNDERTLRNAISTLSAVVRAYPNLDGVAKADEKRAELYARLCLMNYNRAVFYDTIRENSAAAIVAYEEFLRMFPDAQEAAVAQSRLTELRKKETLNEIMRYKKGDGTSIVPPNASAETGK